MPMFCRARIARADERFGASESEMASIGSGRNVEDEMAT
jgi:hypothetical protein